MGTKQVSFISEFKQLILSIQTKKKLKTKEMIIFFNERKNYHTILLMSTGDVRLTEELKAR
jgi:hypothetical protein